MNDNTKRFVLANYMPPVRVWDTKKKILVLSFSFNELSYLEAMALIAHAERVLPGLPEERIRFIVDMVGAYAPLGSICLLAPTDHLPADMAPETILTNTI